MLKPTKPPIDRGNNPYLSLNLSHLMKILHSLRYEEFYYTREFLYHKMESPVWLAPACSLVSEEETALMNPAFLKKWKLLPAEPQYSVTGLQMEFRHFFTDERKYLYIRRENGESGEETLMWLSEENGSLGRNIINSDFEKHYGTMPPLFEAILEDCDILFRPNYFHKVDNFSLLTGPSASLFGTLFSWGFRQTGSGYWEPQGNRIAPEWDAFQRNESENQCDGAFEQEFEQLSAWAGEFEKVYRYSSDCEYLYIVLRRRITQENPFDTDEAFRDPYLESQLTVYAARCSYRADHICWTPFEMAEIFELPDADLINEYLDSCRQLDQLFHETV